MGFLLAQGGPLTTVSESRMDILQVTCSFHQLRARRALAPFQDVQLRTRRALAPFQDVQLRTRRARSLYKVYGQSALLVLYRQSLSVTGLLALDRQYAVKFKRHRPWPCGPLSWIPGMWFTLCQFHTRRHAVFGSSHNSEIDNIDVHAQ